MRVGKFKEVFLKDSLNKTTKNIQCEYHEGRKVVVDGI